MSNDKYICVNCFKVYKGRYNCCGENTLNIGKKLRLPSIKHKKEFKKTVDEWLYGNDRLSVDRLEQIRKLRKNLDLPIEHLDKIIDKKTNTQMFYKEFRKKMLDSVIFKEYFDEEIDKLMINYDKAERVEEFISRNVRNMFSINNGNVYDYNNKFCVIINYFDRYEIKIIDNSSKVFRIYKMNINNQKLHIKYRRNLESEIINLNLSTTSKKLFNDNVILFVFDTKEKAMKFLFDYYMLFRDLSYFNNNEIKKIINNYIKHLKKKAPELLC